MFSLINNQSVMGQNQDILSKTVITEKRFVVNSLRYLYTNTCKFQKLPTKQDNMQLEIRNLPCVMVGNLITKITQIHYSEQVYKIEDTYIIQNANSTEKSQISCDKSTNTLLQVANSQSNSSSLSINSSNKDSDKSNTKKLCIFKKSNEKQQSQKRNTKNVPKNFCKAFINFLTKQKSRKMDKQKITNCMHYVRNLIGDKKYYNNRMILKIVSSNSCKELFRMFLEEHAKEWIERSKMDNKKVHLDAIEIYLRLYERRTFLEGDDEDQQQQS